MRPFRLDVLRWCAPISDRLRHPCRSCAQYVSLDTYLANIVYRILSKSSIMLYQICLPSAYAQMLLSYSSITFQWKESKEWFRCHNMISQIPFSPPLLFEILPAAWWESEIIPFPRVSILERAPDFPDLSSSSSWAVPLQAFGNKIKSLPNFVNNWEDQANWQNWV